MDFKLDVEPNLDDVPGVDGVITIHQLYQALGPGFGHVVDLHEVLVVDDVGLDETPSQVGVNLAGTGDDVRILLHRPGMDLFLVRGVEEDDAGFFQDLGNGVIEFRCLGGDQRGL